MKKIEYKHLRKRGLVNLSVTLLGSRIDINKLIKTIKWRRKLRRNK